MYISCEMMRFVLVALVLANYISSTEAVDRSKFRTCADTRFCRTHRKNSLQPSGDHKYKVVERTFKLHDEGYFSALIESEKTEKLDLFISAQVGGSFRVKIAQKEQRWQPIDLLSKDGLNPLKLTELSKSDLLLPKDIHKEKDFVAFYADTPSNSKKILVVYTDPLQFDFYDGNTKLITVNDRQLMHYEMTRQDTTSSSTTISNKLNDLELNNVEDKHKGKKVVDYGEDGLAIYEDGSREEKTATTTSTSDHITDISSAISITEGDNFQGHRDTEPLGPTSIGLDFTFPYAQYVYGIPEHTTPLALPTTAPGLGNKEPRYSEPYRLYNLDVFEYEIDVTMALYGHIPLMLAHGLVNGKGVTSGMFWFNPSETFIDISDGLDTHTIHSYKQTHWISETGDIDFFLFTGPTFKQVHEQYSSLTGKQQLPPMFSLGYHQCRWNYRDERDVASVDSMFESLDYPMDVIWLDIEHTDGKRYFTWDKSVFPNPIEMQKNISAHGRKMVTIIDPHIKRDDNYPIHKEAEKLGLYIKNKDGQDFDGWCWPGSSSYLDFTSSTVRKWWADRFHLDVYKGSTMDLFTWNDMNEPSVFNGPEVSMSKDCKNLQGIEHRYWHNLYGLYMQSATADGLMTRTPPPTTPAATSLFSSAFLARSSTIVLPPELIQRPFVLSRAFWAGSQKYGAIWTGDNAASWTHLQIAAPMLLSINLAGLSFAGADVGGFFGDPSPELFTRWYQAGAFTPFFRGHAHHDTKRREPWVYGEPYTSILRHTAMLRYRLLPYWYSTFHEAYHYGHPVMRPLFTEYPDDSHTFTIDHTWMIGSSLLIHPVTVENQREVSIYFPGTQPWYDLLTYKMILPSAETVTIEAPLEKIPVFIRGGSILPQKLRLRRSSKLMFYDPITLIIAPDSQYQASGHLYLDDESTMAHEVHQTYIWRQYIYNGHILSSIVHNDSKESTDDKHQYKPNNTIEKIIILNYVETPTKVLLKILKSRTLSEVNAESTLIGRENSNNSSTTEIPLSFIYDNNQHILTIKKPDVLVSDIWSIEII